MLAARQCFRRKYASASARLVSGTSVSAGEAAEIMALNAQSHSSAPANIVGFCFDNWHDGVTQQLRRLDSWLPVPISGHPVVMYCEAMA
jgi:hypothetical protein